MAPVWLITGASAGFGQQLALRALKAGHSVIATMRNKTRAAEAAKSIEAAGGHVIEMDMTESQAAIAEKIKAAEAIHGRIDYLINNAGYSLLGPVEAFNDYEVEKQIQTNLYGPLYAIQAALPGMRSRHSGTIVNVSSVAGQDAKPSCGMYSASKFALEGLSEALALEVKDFGISVLIVEPGAFRTNFLVSMNLNDKGVPEPYVGGVADKALEAFKAYNGKQPGDVAKGVERMFEVVAGEGMAGKLTGKVRRMILGEDAYTRIVGKNDDVRRDLETGKEVTFSTKVDE